MRDIEIGYFDPDRRDYQKETFAGSHELASLNGTLSIVDGAPTWHLHVTIADTEHRIRGASIQRHRSTRAVGRKGPQPIRKVINAFWAWRRFSA